MIGADAVDADPAQRAIAASLLGELPAPFRARILAGALSVELPAGGTIYRDEEDPRCLLIITGLVRVLLSAPDGRTLTIRYARAGELLGIPTIVGGPLQFVGIGLRYALEGRRHREPFLGGLRSEHVSECRLSGRSALWRGDRQAK